MNECKCGCGGAARYAYAPGHRPHINCSRCGKGFSPTKSEYDKCSQCRRHIREGGPEVLNRSLSSARKMQAASPEGKRWCSGCQKYRAIKFFPPKGDGGLSSRCKPCRKVQMRTSTLPRRYGITIEQYEEIKEAQGGVCYICQVATGATKALAVDHDHACCPGKTSCGQCVRGLACSSCNKMLGFARDRVEFFERAIRYLKEPPAHKVIERKANNE